MLFGRSTHIIDIHDDWALWTFLLRKLFSESLQSRYLFLSLFDNPFEGAKVAWRCVLIQQIDIDVLREGEFALVDCS